MRAAACVARVAAAACVVCLAAQLAAAPTRAQGVSIGRFDVAHVRASRAAGALPAPPLAPRARWTLTLDDPRLWPPLVAADGGVFVAGSKGLYAIDASGRLLWLAAVGPLAGPPALAPNADVIVARDRGVLERFGRDGSRRVLALDALRAASAPLVSPRAAIFVGDDRGVVRVLDPAGLQLEALDLRVRAAPVLAMLDESTVVASIGTASFGVISLDAGIARVATAPSRIVAGPVASGDARAWWLGDDGVLSAVDREGRIVARLPPVPGLRAGFAAGRDSAVRVATNEAVLLCLESDGRERWRRGLEGQAGPITLDARDRAIFTTNRGSLYAIEADGITRFHVSVPTREAPAVSLGADGTLYFAAQGVVQAWR